jgi:hypothetical protein
MDHNNTPSSSARDAYMVIVLCVMLGIPCFVFFNVITMGLLLALLGGVAVTAAVGAAHYLLWGRNFNQEVAGEREEEQLRARQEAEAWPYDEPKPRHS